MIKRKIKNTDIEIAPINLGGNVFGWTLDEQQSFDILDRFVDLGFNFLDTADTYSWWVNGVGGQSETIIGKWLKARGCREKMVVATKVGSETKVHPADISKKQILKKIDESLQRLRTDYIDIYYTHFDDGKTPVEESLSAYDEIVKAGKVRYIAVSNVSPSRIEASFRAAEKYNFPKYVALQPHYNLLVRTQFEKEYAPIAEKYDLSVFPYWSLEAGFLTGKYRKEADFEQTTRGGSLKKYLDETGKSVLAALDQVAENHASQPAAVALAWLLARPLITAPIASATKGSHLQTMAAAAELRLTDADLKLLNQAGE